MPESCQILIHWAQRWRKASRSDQDGLTYNNWPSAWVETFKGQKQTVIWTESWVNLQQDRPSIKI